MKRTSKSSAVQTVTGKEGKSDTTTRVAREIIEIETAARKAKMDRLRAARLSQPVPEVPVEAPKKKRSPSSSSAR